MIIPLANREPIDAFLFTPQLSNNVRANPNKYAVPQQKELRDFGIWEFSLRLEQS
jgi:hypothetical protein